MSFFNIFKSKDEREYLDEPVQSYTVKWNTYGSSYGGGILVIRTHHRVFVNYDDAKIFEKELIEAGKFLNAWVNTEVYLNQ